MKRRQFLEIGSACILSATPVARTLAKPEITRLDTGFVFDNIYLEHHLSPQHPESPQRVQEVIMQMRNNGLLEQVRHISQSVSADPWIYKIHSKEHINSIQAKYGHSHDVAMAVVSGVLSAVDAVCTGRIRNAFCATRPPGHHASNTGRVEGFCFYNAIAVAARFIQQQFNLEKILIVDWDYHHGNATEAAFYDDPTVLFFSTHDRYAYPGTGDPARTGIGAGKGYNINVHLPCESTNKDIVNAFENFLVPAANRFKPDMILISAGFDSREEDLLGCFNVTDAGFVTLTRLVMSLADRFCNGRIVSILEGGYNLKGNASAVAHHVRTLMEQQG